MTLTKDHYYILPNATLIQEGVTVTVEPGTQLQFWTDDPHDAYADTAITYLKVDGTLLCQGTEDEHIRMFPSEPMSQYRVQLYEGDRGTIRLFYTDMVNPRICLTTTHIMASPTPKTANSAKTTGRSLSITAISAAGQ